MKIQHFLFFCLVPAVINATQQMIHYVRTEGEDLRINFDFPVAVGSRKYFCRNDCKENVLVETYWNRAQAGKFVVRYDFGKVHGVILELTKADTGHYRLGVSNSSSQSSTFQDIRLQVTDMCDEAALLGPSTHHSAPLGGAVTFTCSVPASQGNRKFLCKVPCQKYLIFTSREQEIRDRYQIQYSQDGFFNVTMTQLTQADTGVYRCGSGPLHMTNPCQVFEVTVAAAYQWYNYILPLCLIALVMFLAVFLLLWCRRGPRRCAVCVKAQENANDTNMETATYHTVSTVAADENQTYQELDPHSMDQKQYSSLTQRCDKTVSHKV